MGICSDSPFTEDEFRWWKQHLLADKLPLPSVKSVERKMKDLVTFKNHVLTDTEVRDIVERRQNSLLTTVSAFPEYYKSLRFRNDARSLLRMATPVLLRRLTASSPNLKTTSTSRTTPKPETWASWLQSMPETDAQTCQVSDKPS